jgi:E3 ubiquitin-protein ligase RNF14
MQNHLISLKTLPPLLLSLTLPPEYPLYTPPRILSIHATSSWIPRVRILQEKLLEKWHAPDGVLYEWVEWIHSSDFLRALDLKDLSGDIRYALSTESSLLLFI